MTLQAGMLVERYRIEGIIGQGGMATVYRAKHQVLGTLHAIKVLHRSQDRQSKGLINEGRLQARLDPDFVVPVHDVLTVCGSPALLMPLVQGCSLRDILEGGSLSEHETAAIITAVARAVAQAHAQNIVHRDLKPSNVMLDLHRGRVRVRVADFGIAINLTTHSSHGGFSGTPSYAPPEQLMMEGPPHPSQDLWSIGVMLVECLTGRRPYVATSLIKLLLTIQKTPPQLGDLGDAWRPLVGELLSINQHERGPAAASLPNAIATICTPSTLTHQSPLAQRIQRRLKGHALDTSPSSSRTIQRHLGHVLAPQDTLDADDVNAPTLGIQHNLPAERDIFIGRKSITERIHRFVEADRRMLTLLGIGGAGKTRLALHFARQTIDQWPGGAWFCDLSESRTLDDVVATVARALQIPLNDSQHRLTHAISGRGKTLIILDNMEQVVGVARETINTWLTNAPEAVFIATSRVVLSVQGEQTYPIPAMTTSNAEALFAARARLSNSSFDPDDDDMTAIRALLERLDHLPLAIELAAARSRIMSPQTMLSRVDQRFKLLQSKNSPAPRHRTLRSMLDWSWDLLKDWERAALAQCSVFEGAFDLEAAEATLDLGPYPDAPWPVDAIHALIDKSLIRALGDDRFTLIATVHDYAREKLELLGMTRATEQRHGAYYASFGTQEALSALEAQGSVKHQRTLQDNFSNLMASWERAHKNGDTDIAFNTLMAVGAILKLVGPYSTAVSMTAGLLEDHDLCDGDKARTLHLAANLHNNQGLNDVARDQLQRAFEMYTALGHTRAAATAMTDLAKLESAAGRQRVAQQFADDALAIHRANGYLREEGVTLTIMGNLAIEGGKHTLALQRYREALTIHRRVRNTHSEGLTLINIGVIQMIQGHYEDALNQYGEALRIHQKSGDLRNQATTLNNMGIAYMLDGRVNLAARHHQNALKIHRRIGALRNEAITLFNLGELAVTAQDWTAANDTLIEARFVARRGFPSLVGVIMGMLAKVYAHQGHMERALNAIAEGEPAVRQWGRTTETAKFLFIKAAVLFLSNKADDAAIALEEAKQIHAQLGGNIPEIQNEMSYAHASQQACSAREAMDE